MQASFPPTDMAQIQATMDAIPGRLQFIGNVTVTENVVIALTAGNKRKVLDLAGVTSADTGRLVFVPITPCDAGCEALNVYYSAAGKIVVAYSTPLLAVGSVINIPIAVYRLT